MRLQSDFSVFIPEKTSTTIVGHFVQETTKALVINTILSIHYSFMELLMRWSFSTF